MRTCIEVISPNAKRITLNVLLFSLLATPLIAQDHFDLNENGASRLFWPFGPTSSWTDRAETYNLVSSEWRTLLEGEFHHGSDKFAQDWNFGTKNDDLGHPVYAPGPGEIIFVERKAKKPKSCKNSSYGRQVVIRFKESNFAMRMAHLDEIAEKIEVGSTVRTGQFLGTIGHSGLANKDSCTTHLHAVLYSEIYDDSPQLARLMNGWRPQRSKKNEQLSAAFTFSAVKEKSAGREPIGPNLVVQKVEVDRGELKMGQSAVSHCTIENTGNRNTRKRVTLKYVLSLDTNLDRRDTEVGSEVIAPLRAGHSIRSRNRFELPNASWEGQLHLLCFIDADKILQELDEEDNIWGTELTIR